MGRAGRNDAPALLFDLYNSHTIGDDILRALVLDAWSAAEWPSGNLPRHVWLDWFRLAAFPAPAAPLAVYRGATPPYARGMSWTTDLDRARWFAARWTMTTGRPAHVYTVTADPSAVLADVDAIEGTGGRMEREIVVDPSMLPRLRRVSR